MVNSRDTITIDVPRGFSQYPGGRFSTDGPFSGERFREETLVPALKTGREVHVELDGALGYGSSFLEEAFGGAVRVHGLDCENLSLGSRNANLTTRIRGYIDDAKHVQQFVAQRNDGIADGIADRAAETVEEIARK